MKKGLKLKIYKAVLSKLKRTEAGSSDMFVCILLRWQAAKHGLILYEDCPSELVVEEFFPEFLEYEPDDVMYAWWEINQAGLDARKEVVSDIIRRLKSGDLP